MCCALACQPPILHCIPVLTKARQGPCIPACSSWLSNMEADLPSFCYYHCTLLHAFWPVPALSSCARVGLLGTRQPCLYLARMALFDKQHNRFLGNIMGARPVSVKENESTWLFSSQVFARLNERGGTNSLGCQEGRGCDGMRWDGMSCDGLHKSKAAHGPNSLRRYFYSGRGLILSVCVKAS